MKAPSTSTPPRRISVGRASGLVRVRLHFDHIRAAPKKGFERLLQNWDLGYCPVDCGSGIEEVIAHGKASEPRDQKGRAHAMETARRVGLEQRIKHQKMGSSGDSLGALGLPACEPSWLLELE
jgi:hypothetical protein